jgi:hypothetical protein
MAGDYSKQISVKFEPLSDAEEANLSGFIQQEIVKKNISVDLPNTEEKKQREAFRVVFRDMMVEMVMEATSKVPQSELDVRLEDISLGGCCIGLPKNQPVVKGVTVYLTLHFCNPAISVRGTVLGLRRD